MNIATLLQTGKKLNNYAEDATGGGLWVSTTHYTVVVPANKRWILLGGVFNRDANATLYVYIKDASDKTIALLGSYSASTGLSQYPLNTGSPAIGGLLLMDAGEYLDAVAGAAQGAGAYASLQVIELSL